MVQDGKQKQEVVSEEEEVENVGMVFVHKEGPQSGMEPGEEEAEDNTNIEGD